MKRWSTVQDFISNGKAPTSETVATFEGFASKGDGGASLWLRLAGTDTPSQSPVTRGDNKLTDSTGQVWAVTEGSVFYYDGTNNWFPSPFGDSGNGLYQFNGASWNYYEQSGGAVSLSTTVNLITSSFAYGVGTALEFTGYASPGDGGVSQWKKTASTGAPSQTPVQRGDGTLTDATGAVWELVNGASTFDVAVNVPSNFTSIQSAVDFYHNKIFFADGFELVINIEAGHQPATGVSVTNGDYGYIRITSDDAEVVVDPLWGGGGFLLADNARSPVLDTVVNLDGLATSSGYYLNNSSVGYIISGAGMRNGANRGAHISNGSTLAADGCVFTGFDQAGIHASRASTVQCADADLSGNSQDPANTFGALYASRNSRIHGPSINLTNSGGDGVRVQRLASIVAPDVDVSGCTGIAFVANGGDIMSDSGSPTTNNLQGQLLNAQNNGRVYLGEVNATFDAGMTDFAIECRQATVYIKLLTMSGHEGIGIYAIGAGAIIDCPAYTAVGGLDGVNCLDLASVNVERCNITNQTRLGVFATSGARVTIEDGTVSGSVSGDINCDKGSQIVAINATTTSGAVNTADTNFSAFNTIESNKGIIWA